MKHIAEVPELLDKPHSKPASCSDLFSTIRELFAGTHEPRTRSNKLGRFSFNLKGGRWPLYSGKPRFLAPSLIAYRCIDRSSLSQDTSAAQTP